ncbi:heavy-metal-associated domain-containing protein [Chitinophaga nivalis]|uniref:Heavy-metal-associated domain-containing protein n=1 Tax=Chitinophaga nivalis TaxID=2991709 RepID=A0ABT3IQ65_9BACT|nr:heavy-metal-associated domain-containing protein [Chitinophaga nivalis]MCW3464194.1 heavy-metal-associated domain-containing protein [Chitinophaga nivalis]MCW3486116.1 heavy-metal-associated domain-containing protein [Chitinophaga nivalis]
MKKIFSFFIAALSLFSVSRVLAQTPQTDSFKVAGNCNMCKKRIEKAATAIPGVKQAVWDVNTKMMTVTYDAAKTAPAAVQKQVAAAGHDTEKAKAADAVYSQLPGCCRYDRNGGDTPAAHPHH